MHHKSSSRTNKYSAEFYESIKDGSRFSAKLIVPLVIEIIRPKSVIDVGCGTGAWLAEYVRLGVKNYLGVDGNHVDKSRLELGPEHFHVADLSTATALPGNYDLAISLEVAEHLPEARAEQFIRLITSLAPSVLFSAAVPGQGGVGHVNEQWQDYWRELFQAQGYLPVDAIRPKIFGCRGIEPWYQQNMILYIREDISALRPDLKIVKSDYSLNLVHPWTYQYRIDQEQTIKSILRNLPRSLDRALRSRIRRVFESRTRRQIMDNGIKTCF